MSSAPARLALALILNVCAAVAAALAGAPEAPTPQGPEIALSPARSEIVLNGVWRWQPAAGPASEQPQPDKAWGLAWVPGAWGGAKWGGYVSYTPDRDATGGVLRAGEGPAWKTWDVSLRRGWYERAITIPAGWAGSGVSASFDRVGNSARVWLDGRELGAVSLPGEAVDLTAAAKPGREQTLRVLVEYAAGDESINFMGVGQNVAQKRQPDHARGLIGDVVLVRHPAGPRVLDLFVKPSVRERRLALEADLSGFAPGAELAVAARVYPADAPVGSAPERVFEARARSVAPDGGAAPGATSALRDLAWTWENPRLWDLDDPHLYRVELDVRAAPDAAPADVFAATFGFREFRVEGRDFYLNESKIRLRPAGGHDNDVPTAVTAEGHLRRLRGFGANLFEIWPEPKFPAPRVQDRVWAEAADRLGVLLIVPAVRINEFTFGPGYRPIWDGPAGRAAWEPRFRADWRRLRNHPSIVMAGLSGNLGGHAHDQDPRWIGRRALPPSVAGDKPQFKAQREADGVFAAFDPTRPAFHHQGGGFGAVFSVNHYLNLIPLQERAEWFSEWAKTGDMPYMGVELGTPFNATVLRGRDGFGNSINTEPFLAEYAAVYLGRDAYARQGDDYLRAVRGRFSNADAASGGRWSSWQSSDELNFSPAFQDLQALFISRTWRAWRTEGVSGGMIPWDDAYAFARRSPGAVDVPWRPGLRGWFSPSVAGSSAASAYAPEAGYRITPAGEALRANNGPTLAWIAGAPGALHDPDHHLAAGGRLEKQLALLNDTRGRRGFAARWRVEPAGGGSSLASGEFTGELAPAETRLLPVAFAAPADLAPGERRDLAFVLEARIGEETHADRLAFRAYGPDASPATPPVALHDPAGRSARMLEELGVEFRPLAAGEKPPAGALLVLGRESLSSGAPGPDWAGYAAEGGRVLLLAQSPSWAEKNLGLRLAPAPARRVWAVPTGPLADLFDAADLRDWNGEGTLTEARPAHADSPAMPTHGWRWGNTGSVSSAMIEKPHRAGWTPLLEGEWDLAYTPLMELGHGRGRLTWCTLDLEDQAAVDPAAARLARQVLALAARPVATPRVPELVYAGSPAGAAVLRHVGVNFRESRSADPRSPLLVADAATPLSDEALLAHARQGGTVVMLAQPGGEKPPRLGAALRVQRRFAGGEAPVANALTLGLSASDLRLRAPQDQRLLAEARGMTLYAGGLLGARAEGRGRVVFVQFDPLAFDLEKRPFYKHTQWRFTRALSQVLANLGATFAADRLVFDPQITRLELAGEWAVRFTRELELRDWSNPAHKPHPDPGVSEQARALLAERVDVSGWERFALPANHPRFSQVSGEAVWRREVNVPASWTGETVVLHIPAVKSFDVTTINGVEVGATSKDSDPKNPNPWNTPRAYRIPPGVLKAGKNVIAIRQFCPDKDGGVHGRPDRFYLQLLVPEDRRVKPYVDNWNDDFKYGDDPYRYYRW